jgi:hypothetical protein
VASEDIWPGATLSVRARSFVATLQLLSMGVDQSPNAPGPKNDIDSGEELYRLMAGVRPDLDLSPYITAVFRVRCGPAKPDDALVAVRDGRYWYWIDREDRTSRTLFAMVRDMYDLQVTSESQASPILTLPVGTGR